MGTQEAVLPRDLVLRFFPAESRNDPGVLSLASILECFISSADLGVRLDALVSLAAWTASGKVMPGAEKLRRLQGLVSIVESQPQLQHAFRTAMREVVSEMRSVELFAESGLHPRGRLWSEAIRRITQRVLPFARSESDLCRLVIRMYPTSGAIDRLIDLPDEWFERAVRALAPATDSPSWEGQRSDLEQAFQLLAVHVAGIGLSPEIRARSFPHAIEDSPFYRIQLSTVELLRERGRPSDIAAWREQARRIRLELEQVHLRMEDAGVSTSLVFDLLTIEHALNRMDCIVDVLFVAEPHESIAAVKRLLDDVMHSLREEMSLRGLFRENTSLLARKIVERTGKAGEHYIANSRREYRAIWRASLGGGLLTVFTAALKLRIWNAHLPPFVEFLAAGTNYAVSFIVMQHLHFALATKQPSVTAAAFAGIVRTTRGQERREKVAEFVSRITRSQLASAAANLIAVGAGCVVFAKLWERLFTRPYLQADSAAYVYRTLDPLASGTIIFAVLTGLILWISALAGGWFENFVTYYRVPAAIAQHPLGERFGKERMQKLAAFVEANVSGWVTCIVLGYLLAFVPALGKFLGIPLDVRHVTLSTGTLVLAAASFGRDWLYRGWFVQTLYGIAATFVCNLGVSFWIAASVAMRAYGISREVHLQLLGYTVKSLFRSPRRFLLPPREERTHSPA